MHGETLKLKYKVSWGRGGPTVPSGQTDGPTDMTKLKVTFRNFANASKSISHESCTENLDTRLVLNIFLFLKSCRL